jgi:hypothetical protein
MSRPLREGEYDTKCACGTRFRVQTWKVGKDREQCTSCKVYFKSVYRTLEHYSDLVNTPEGMAAANELLKGRRAYEKKMAKVLGKK